MSENQKTVEKSNKGRVAAITVGAAVLCVCVLSFSNNPMTLYALVFTNDLGLSPAEVAFIFSATPMAGFVCSLLAGPIFKKVNFNIIVSTAIGLCALGLVFWSLSDSYWMVIVGALLQGVGVKLGGFLPNQMMLVNWYKKGSGKIVGIVGSMDNLVAAGYIIAVSAMMINFGWRTTAIIQAGCVLIPGLIAGIFLVRYSPYKLGMSPVGGTAEDAEMAKQEAAGQTIEIPGLPFKQIVKSPVFYATLLILMLQTFVMMYFISNQALILGNNGLSTVEIGIAVSAFSITNVINKILFGFVVDKKGVKVAALYCYFGVFAGIFVLLIANSVALGIVYSVLYGLIGGPLTMVGIFVAEKMFGKKDIQLTNSIFQAATALGGILGPIVIAALFTISGDYIIPTIFSATAIIVCIILVLIFIRPKNYFKEDKPEVA